MILVRLRGMLVPCHDVIGWAHFHSRILQNPASPSEVDTAMKACGCLDATKCQRGPEMVVSEGEAVRALPWDNWTGYPLPPMQVS